MVHLEGLAKDKLNVVLCYSQVCHLAATAAFEFAAQGYSVMELEGGFKACANTGLPIDGSEVTIEDSQRSGRRVRLGSDEATQRMSARWEVKQR